MTADGCAFVPARHSTYELAERVSYLWPTAYGVRACAGVRCHR
jgi:hypothetical protein